jgi:uncharacterized protein YyaL (SSP411 family)
MRSPAGALAELRLVPAPKSRKQMTATSHHVNRLAGETSPYLLQHQHNPVDWWPWGPPALAHAEQTGKPILLSVGYAACHWCHVMAHESFEDEDTARVMNELFVNIKVDREERPDIDQIYMSALHLLGEHGGWPLTMFLTPEGEPFWGGTYFPKTARYGRPAFVSLLREVARVFREEPESIAQNQTALMTRLRTIARPTDQVVIGVRELDDIARQIAKLMDPQNGGLRGAPKFPQTSLFELVWRAAVRTKDAQLFQLIDVTLQHICEGGIYDHLGGGFSRYSVDERWLVPHFEKMLYDNAQLLELCAVAHQHTGNALYRGRAYETVTWLEREMTTKEGAFCASLDADSEGEEGKFYVWSLDQITSVLGAKDATFFARHYDVTAEGNFEGHNILNRLLPRERRDEDERRLAAMRDALLSARAQRVRPGLDDKVLADWNGMMIAALVNAGTLLDEPSWIEKGARAFHFIADSMTREGRLGHAWRQGRLLLPGLASDYANMIRAGIALHEANGEQIFLKLALAWQQAFDEHYANPHNGGYYLTADDAQGLVIRQHATSDDATPNANSIAAQNLIRLAVLAGDDTLRGKADRLFDGVLSAAARSLLQHPALLNALDLRLSAAEIVVTGPEMRRFTQAALKIPFFNRIVLRAPSVNSLPPSHPAQEKIKASPETAAFICVGERCSLPVTQAEQIAAAIAGMRSG